MQMFLWTTLISVLMIQRSAARMLVDQCGTTVVGPKIMNGNDAEREAAAWMAAIRNAEQFQCGGTVIHRRFVLTAAHCIEGQSSLFVILGAYNKSNPTREYSVSLAVTHHGYNNRNMDHDIGLLKVSRDIQFGLYVYPICIVLDPSMKRRMDNITAFEAYGWGKTENTKLDSEILQKVTVYRFDRSKCNQFLDNKPPLTSNQLCVGSSNGDTCRGDSGGPLTNKFLLRGTELQIQLAIVSYGKKRCDGAGIYTDVSSYANWIESNVYRFQGYSPGSRTPVLPENVRNSQGSRYRPPPGFASNPPPLNAGSQNRRPHRFPTPGQAMFLDDQCGGDDVSMNLLVKIYGDEFEGKGAMITSRYVLTNAKDLPADASTLEVLTIDDNSLEELKVKSIIKYPDFSGGFSHNIALLKLTKPASLSGRRKPICMLLQARIFQLTIRFPMEIRPVAFRECSDRVNREIEQDQLCIEESEMTKKCGHIGDILGTTVLYKGKEWHVLFGIVSYSSNGLIILTNVMKYTYWIADIVRNY